MSPTAYRICFVIPYYGALPPYLALFLNSCRHNPEYLFLFVTDLQLPSDRPENVQVVAMTLADLSDLIHRKTGIRPRVVAPYKLCDFKPAYGLIFEDLLGCYKNWGHIDIDLVLGRISQFITPEMLSMYDLISARQEWVSGAFSVYRNNATVNRLFQLSEDWERVFADHENYVFDETSKLRQKDPIGIYARLMRGEHIEALDTEVVSFTHVVFAAMKRQALLAKFQTVCKESIAPGMLLRCGDDGVFIVRTGESAFKLGSEWLFYHFITEKQKPLFSYPGWKVPPANYFIDEFGFYTPAQVRFRTGYATLKRMRSSLKRVIVRVKRLLHVPKV